MGQPAFTVMFPMQGSKLVTYMNNRPQQQQQQQQDLTRNLQALQIEKKKQQPQQQPQPQPPPPSSTPLSTLSGVQEFYPASFTAANGAGRYPSGGAASSHSSVGEMRYKYISNRTSYVMLMPKVSQ